MTLESLTAISSVDGRYASKTESLRLWLSEYGLIRQRVHVELRWLEHLARHAGLEPFSDWRDEDTENLHAIDQGFDTTAAHRIKSIEADTNHDVKAVEYYLREAFEPHPALASKVSFIHFAATSEDINNLSYGLMLEGTRREVLLPGLNALIERLRDAAHHWADMAMMARTHGQPATPTTLGKEMANVVWRLRQAKKTLENVSLTGKMNGAVGNYSAHLAAYPDVDWAAQAKHFVTGLGLDFIPYTTQIEPHDCIAEYLDALSRIATILIDLSRDVWGYVSLGYFQQKLVAGEVGSSTMPHKVNPIDFENAEGNLGVARALMGHLSEKLPVSRWQRDLTDSTVLRSLGTGIGHFVIALASLDKGLGRLQPDTVAMARDLDQAWELLAEPIQTVMRAHGVSDAYETLKKLTRGKRIDGDRVRGFIDSLDIDMDARERLKELTPATYLGQAVKLAREV